MFYFIFIIFQISIIMVSSLELEALISRYIYDCPSTNIYTEMPSEELNHITISVLPDEKYINNTGVYNYYQVDKIAKDPNADFTKPTVLFVSGYLDELNSTIETRIGLVYKQLGFTVLLLNARVFSTEDYFRAARDTRPVGKHTAEMLANLTKHGLDPKRFSIVGLSLGAQTSSFIGKYFREIAGTNVSRITGLDPAGPCYRNLALKDHLCPSDADHVEAIKTNMKYYGMDKPVGHIDFYVNGGDSQPGNSSETCNSLCSHLRSYYVWMAALLHPNNFIAMKCDSEQKAKNKDCYNQNPVTNILGLNTDKNKHGIYYLETSGYTPYFLGEEGLKKRNYDCEKNSGVFGLSSIL